MTSNEEKLHKNKEIVRRFNSEVIGKGNVAVFRELMSPEFVNRTAPSSAASDADGMLHTFNHILRPAMPDLAVKIHDQIAEGDKVTTRKTIRGTHLGDFMGIPATRQPISIDVIDIVRIQRGQYVEHWGINTLASVLSQLKLATAG